MSAVDGNCFILCGCRDAFTYINIHVRVCLCNCSNLLLLCPTHLECMMEEVTSCSEVNQVGAAGAMCTRKVCNILLHVICGSCKVCGHSHSIRIVA